MLEELVNIILSLLIIEARRKSRAKFVRFVMKNLR